MYGPASRPIFRAACSGAYLSRFGFDGKEFAQTAVPLKRGRKIRVSFVCPSDHLHELALLVGTYGRRNTCKIHLRILTGTSFFETPLRECDVAVEAVQDNSYINFGFPKIPQCKGNRFVAEFTSPDAGSDNYVAVWAREVGQQDPANGYDWSFECINSLDQFTYLKEDLFLPHFNVQGKANQGEPTEIGWKHEGDPLTFFVLQPERPLRVPVKSDLSQLTHVSFSVGTFDRQNRCRVLCRVFERQGAALLELGRGELGSVELRNNSFCTFRFLEPIEVRERALVIELSSPDSSAGNEIAVWGNLLSPFGPRFQSLVYAQKAGAPSGVNYSTNSWAATATNELEGVEVAVFTEREAADHKADELNHICSELASRVGAVRVFSSSHAESLKYHLRSLHAIVLWYSELNEPLKKFIRAARDAFIPVIAIEPRIGITPNNPMLHATLSQELRGKQKFRARALESADLRYSLEEVGSITIKDIKASYLSRRRPLVSVVSILYGKEREVPFFLRSLFKQTYQGEIEIVLVNDKTKDGSVRAVTECYESLEAREATSTKPNLKIIENEKNLGNCGSRNVGLVNATGNIILIVDADCVFNRTFIQRHVEAHARNDCDVVIGPCNLETKDKEPFEVLRCFEEHPERVLREGEFQDPLCLSSFLNCVTRNFSIKRAQVKEELFDEQFTYSADPASGYGWEDVELGYRLYQSGAQIAFEPEALSVHVSHLSPELEMQKAPRAMRNFRRLVEKHPELILVARRWVGDTFEKLSHWLEVAGEKDSKDLSTVAALLSPHKHIRYRPREVRHLRVLTYRWHCPHQYELYKLPHEFTLLQQIGPAFTNYWNYDQRPFPNSARFVSVQDLNPREYDVAILHFDENCLSPQLTNGVLEENWGAAFQWCMQNLKLPKVAICHGTPQFYGQYGSSHVGKELGEVIEAERERLVDFLGDTHVVCNSYQAEREWGFQKSSVIWQGFDPVEFLGSTYRKGIVSLGKEMQERPYYRGYQLYQNTFKDFPSEWLPGKLEVTEPDLDYLIHTNAYARTKFRSYVNSIRDYSVYFNPTIRSPMPRSRGEAMMCGLVTVSAQNHDIDMFVRNGENGFFSKEAGELREFLAYLMKNPARTKEMGAQSRSTALDLFNHDRYLQKWNELLSELVR